MALYRSTLLIGLICAVFTTAGYGGNTDPDGAKIAASKRQPERNYDVKDPCPDNLTKKNVFFNNAYGDCKNGKWTFTKCPANTERALHCDKNYVDGTDIRSYFASLKPQNYCIANCKPEDGIPIMGEVNGIKGRIKFKNGTRCLQFKEFCNTAAARAAFQHATAIETKDDNIADLQKKLNAIANEKDRINAFELLDTTEYQKYCCATKCEPGYKPDNCKCVQEQVEQPAEPEKHKITYECNDGIGCNTCQPKEYTSGTATAAPNPKCTPTKTNHKFMGWCTNKDLSGSCSDQYTIPAAHYSDVVLYAKWLEDSKPGIKYYLHGGTGCTDSSSMPDTYTPGTGATITCQPTLNGYEFSGWCEGNENCDTPTAPYVIGTDATGDKEMHAVWKQNAIMRGSVTCTDYAGCGTATVFDKLNPVLSAHFAEKSSSVWKNDEGKFNTARLASDSIAGVVLGTVGGVVTSTVMKKNQVKKGFENIQCTVDSQPVASYGDEFSVGLLQM